MFCSPLPGCTDFDCKSEGGQCGMNPDFCGLFPATYSIDHVRVYQNKNDSRQTIGGTSCAQFVLYTFCVTYLFCFAWKHTTSTAFDVAVCCLKGEN